MTNLDSSTSTAFDFTTNTLLGGILAKIYTETDYQSPIHNWAASIPNRELIVDSVHYRANTMRQVVDGQETNGIQLTVIDQRGDTPVQSLYFFPVQNLRAIKFSLEGYRLD